MVKNYIKIAFRNIIRQKGYSFINIFGLSVGISACIFIAAFIHSELNYDKHHINAENIFRINTEFRFPSQNTKTARNSLPFAPLFLQDVPGIKSFLRIFPAQRQTVTYRDKMFNQENIALVDSNLLDFFNYKLISGTKQDLLNVPLSVIISEEKAKLYFGSARDAIDKFLKFQHDSYRVTGVFQKPEEESHLNYDFYISISSLPQNVVDQAMNDFMWMITYTYIMTDKGKDKADIEQGLKTFYDRRISPWLKENQVQGNLLYYVQPLSEIHLSTDYEYDTGTNSNPVFISIFLTAGIFILVVACFNYLNLITARSFKRSKEVGIRKVLGAARKNLLIQFLGESAIITFIAFVFAFGIISLFHGTFNYLTGKNFTEADFLAAELLLPLAIIFIFISALAGSYPAVYLSGFSPTSVLKAGVVQKKYISGLLSPSNFRKILVVFQFAISITLIAGTIVIYDQFNFIKNKDLGFNKDQVAVIDIPSDTLITSKIEYIKEELKQNGNISQAAVASHIPGTMSGALYFNAEQENGMADKLLNYILVDDNYLDLMGIPLVEGRNFSKEITTDKKAAFIINESAAKFLNWNQPIGKKMINGRGNDGKVIGVIKDYNYTSLHTPISPLVLIYEPDAPGYLLTRVSPVNLENAVQYMLNTWKRFDQTHPAEYFFLDDNFDKIYRKEKDMLTLFTIFAVLAVIISSLGLFGLASFVAEQKTKEIGIRKVLGASVAGIAGLLSADFLKLVLLSNIIAIPAAFWGMNYWLQDFAYRINISYRVFILAGLFALVISIIAVSYQAIKAAHTDPVKALKYE